MPSGPDEPTRSDEDVLVEYVEVALAQIEAGEEPDLAKICGADGHLVQAVAEAVGLDRTAFSPTASKSVRDHTPSDPLIGRKLAGRYVLDNCVGLGAMGAVHRARDVSLDRFVAVKVMHGGMFPDASRQARFAREAKVLAALQDPTVVPIHDHGQTDDGLFFLVMDLLDGVSLAAVLRHATEADVPLHSEDWSSALDIAATERTFLRQIVSWTAQLAGGLATAHDAGVVHRDVKPSNVFITRDGRAVLLDFGIAAREGDASLTAAETTLGTPWYMAPEQASAGDTARPAVDVYGLGASLYHLLTRRPPYEGDVAEVIYKLRSEDPPPPHVLVKGLPRDLCAIVEKALDRKPELRYPSMAEFAADLNAFLDHRPVVARPLTSIGRFARRVRRRPAPAIAVVAVTVALPLAVLALLLYQWNTESSDQTKYDELIAKVPALVCLEGYPDKRLLEDMSESARAVDLLTEILELKPEDVRTRLMRASLYLDRGERGASIADLERIHTQCDTPYTAALLEAYKDANDSARGANALKLDGLPEPSQAIDWFIAGFHTLRARKDYEKAHMQLGRAAESEDGTSLPIARDLRLVTWLVLATLERDMVERRNKYETALSEAHTLEGIYGRKTARTRHTMGAALVGLKRYEKAIEPLEDSLELRPERHGPLHNLGIAYRRTSQLDRAEDYLMRAHALRPWLWNTLLTLSQVQCDRSRFAEALAFAEKIPTTGTMGEAWQRPLLIARVHLNHAFYLLRERDFAGAKAPARLAIPAFDESFRNGCIRRERVPAEYERKLAVSIVGGGTDAVGFLDLWRKDLRNPVMIQNLEALLYQQRDLTPELLLSIRIYLLRLAIDLAPYDPIPRARLEKLYKEGK